MWLLLVIDSLWLRSILKYFWAVTIMWYLRLWFLYYLLHQKNPHSFSQLAFAAEQTAHDLMAWSHHHFDLGHRSLHPCVTGWLAGELVTRWSGMAFCVCLQAGSWQLGISFSSGWSLIPSGLAGPLSCWSQGDKHINREKFPLHDSQIPSCVMRVNVLLIKASQVAKLGVIVGGSYQGRGFWDLLPSSANHLPHAPLFSHKKQCFRKKKCLLTF